MQLTGTHINYYHTCKRELWLFANGINMEHTSDTVADGKLVHETSYADRAEKFTEISIAGIKVDFYDAHTGTVHETKRTASVEEAHEWQLKYYIYVLQQNGIPARRGILEYPRLREKKEFELTVADKAYLEEIMPLASEIIHAKSCPPARKIKICRSCSYHDFCWVGEEDE